MKPVVIAYLRPKPMDKKSCAAVQIEYGQYQDIDEYAADLVGRSVQFAQMESGVFACEQTQLLLDDYRLLFFQHNLSTLNCATQLGQGLAFCIPLSQEPVTYLEHAFQQPKICCVPNGGEVRTVTPSLFSGAILFLSSELQHHLLSRYIDSPMCCPCRYGNTFFKPNPAQLASLQQALWAIQKQLKQQYEQASIVDSELEAELRNQIEFVVTPLLYQIMSNSHGKPVQYRPDNLTQALRLIANNLDNPPTITELSSHIGISSRALQYLFKNHLGLTPKQFIGLCRLNAARRKLRCAHYQRGGVADIANQLGYWHMGGFAQDFKRLFKVSPTELLRLDADKL
jgi:AraC family ethanolamine operon transcriptional activator